MTRIDKVRKEVRLYEPQDVRRGVIRFAMFIALMAWIAVAAPISTFQRHIDPKTYALPAKHLSDSLRAQYPTLATNP